jgi:zinc/manganese transport system substrate-binding protein
MNKGFCGVLIRWALRGRTMTPRAFIPQARTKLGLARVALAPLALGAALIHSGAATAADKIKVVATFSVIGDMVTNVAGDHVDVTTIVPPDGDTEEYEPTAGDVPKLAGARILFMNGLNDEFEPWLESLMKQARYSGTKLIVTRGVRSLTAEDEHPVGGKPKASALDQHAWMDPRNGVIYVKNITDALVRADPAGADDYHSRAAAYTRQLRALDDWAHTEMAGVPAAKRRVLASHDSLQYLANAFGITMISVNGWTNKAEPSAADLARLTDQIQREHVKALFLDSITDPRAMKRISVETGAVIGGTLYGDALSKPDGEAATYIEMIRHDVSTMKAGMLLN